MASSKEEQTQDLSELRIVLLGGRCTGKSSAGNTILGKEEFVTKRRTVQCVKRQSEVAGRQVTVVDTPGWWINRSVEETPEADKQEIVHSVSLCPPGPCALFIVLNIDGSFTETERRSVEGHLELLNGTVWRHTIVLFTRGDWLGDRTIEQHIEAEGEALRWLVGKCGNRCHVLNNQKRGDVTQVTELLEKVEEMMAGNSGRHFEINRKIIEKVEEKKRSVEKREKQRMMMVKNQRKTLGALFKEQTQDLSELRIVLLGGRRTGKSSAGNTILGREEFVTEGRTVQCVKRQREVAGRQVTVVDTPGWWKNCSVEETPEADKQEIVHSVSLCPPGPCALFIVLNVDASFTETKRRSVEGHLELLNGTVWRHTIVLFTSGDWLGDGTIEQHIEAEGEALRWLVGKCGNRYHVLNNQKRGDVTQVTELLEKVEEMVTGNSGRHFEIDRLIIEKVEEKKRSVEDRAKQRMMKVENQRKTLRALFKEQTQDLSELRIVLLGGRRTGKSSAGNTILGREEFVTEGRTVQCVKRQREVAGRQVTVVDTPGWWKDWSVKQTPELDKQEIVHSVSLCPPGPCALLIVLRVDASFTETHRRSVEGHLELLSWTVWRHTIVLFTCGDWLGDRTIEQHIEAEGEALRWLVWKCGNRYHVLNNEKRGDVTQVTELLEKVEEMVARNSGRHFEIDRMMREKVEEKKRSVEERAKQRMMKVENQRKTLRALFKVQTQDLSELRIVLLGGRCTGKSSAGNTILGREEFVTKGRTAQCVKRQREVAGRQVTVVDTPGWWMNCSVEETPEADKQEIVHSVSLCPPGPCALFIVLNVDASFTETERRSVVGHLELLSGTVWRHTIVLFTSGDWLGDRTIEQHIEAEGEALQWLVGKCGNRYHVLNNEKRGDVTQVTELLEKVEEMVARNSGRHFTVGEREDSWEQLLETAGINKVIKQRIEEELNRREEELIEKMSLLVNESPRKMRGSIPLNPPSFNEESAAHSEAGYSVLDGEVGHRLVSKKVSEWMEKNQARASSSGYGSQTSASAAPSEARDSVLDTGRGPRLMSRKMSDRLEKYKAGASSSGYGTQTSASVAPSEARDSVLDARWGPQLDRAHKLHNILKKEMASSNGVHTQDLSELRTVLLGGRQTGKSSAGNTILGREEFDTKRRTTQCVKRQREVAGRQVTVVDTPGWWKDWSVEKTSEADNQEILHSVSLCPPGPCALFIVLNVDASFTETHRRSVEEHLQLLSGTVWRHTIVLFTRGDWLGDRTIEQHIEAEGEALRWLVGKCGNRYHVLNNEKRGDVTQVTELLEKVEEMVAGNSGRHFEIDRMIIEKMEEKKRSVEERAKQRMMKVENQRKTFRALFKAQTQDLSELRIVLLGGKQIGKSSAGNTILGREEFVTKRRTAQCVKRQREVAGRQVTVVDTPGWWKNWSVEKTPEADKQEIVHSVSLCPPGPCALFIVLSVDASFTETHRRSVEEHLELLSGTVWRHTIVLFTRGDWLGDRTIEQHIEAEGEALQWLVGKCGNRYHVLNNEKRGDVTQVTELLEKVEEMVAGNSGRHFTVGEREDSWKQLLERAGIRKEIKQQFEEEWSRREEQLIEMMSLLVGDDQTDQPPRRRTHSISHPPYFCGLQAL